MKLDINAFDKLHFKDSTYSFAQGKENFIENLSEHFQEESKNIRSFVNYIEKTAHQFPGFNPIHTVKMPDTDIWQKNAYLEIQKFIKNPILQNVLFGNSFAYVGDPEKTPFYVYALIMYGYIESAYRVIGGSGKIADQLAKNITQKGGTIKYDSSVKKIVSDSNKRIKGIITETDDFIQAENVISTIHPSVTIALTDDNLFRKTFRERVTNLKNTSGVFTVYAKLKKNKFPFINSVNYCMNCKANDTEPIYRRNLFGEKILAITQPNNFINENSVSLLLMTPFNIDKLKKWHNTKVGKRGKDYKNFKKEKTEQLIDISEQFFPGIKDAVESTNSSTPLTYRDYTGTINGSVYGIEKDVNNLMLTNISHKTKIPNLFLAGQNTNIHGVHGVAAGSYSVCSYILGKEYLRKKFLL